MKKTLLLLTIICSFLLGCKKDVNDILISKTKEITKKESVDDRNTISFYKEYNIFGIYVYRFYYRTSPLTGSNKYVIVDWDKRDNYLIKNRSIDVFNYISSKVRLSNLSEIGCDLNMGTITYWILNFLELATSEILINRAEDIENLTKHDMHRIKDIPIQPILKKHDSSTLVVDFFSWDYRLLKIFRNKIHISNCFSWQKVTIVENIGYPLKPSY